jgi:hypothetical protein
MLVVSGIFSASAFTVNYGMSPLKFSSATSSMRSLPSSNFAREIPQGRGASFSLSQRKNKQSGVNMNLGSAQGLGYNLAIAVLASPPMQPLLVGGILASIVAAAWYWLAIPSRTYVEGDDTVGKEYDAWTEEGILEYYWVKVDFKNSSGFLCVLLARLSRASTFTLVITTMTIGGLLPSHGRVGKFSRRPNTGPTPGPAPSEAAPTRAD